MNIFQELSSLIQQNIILFMLYFTYNFTVKGIALWRSAKNSHIYWFIIFLFVNLFGIPELLYIFYFSKKQLKLPYFNLRGKSTKK